MPEQTQYAPAVLDKLSSLFALKDSNDENYLSGPKLVALFNSLGFADAYRFPGGIQVPGGSNGLSLTRTQYVMRRLTELNEKFQAPKAIQELLRTVNDAAKLQEQLSGILSVGTSLSNSGISSASVTPSLSPAIQRPELGVKSLAKEKPKITDNSRDVVFDDIPTGVKVAFISYSWDDEEHKAWTRKLAKALFDNGIFALLDQHNPKGYPIPHFMNKGMDLADKVIVLGTPRYLEKCMKSVTGGVPYEESIINSALMINTASIKFIPVLRMGTFSTSFPPLLATRNGFDFTDDAEFDKLVASLVDAINDTPEYPRPMLGTVKTTSYKELSPAEREELKSPVSDFRKKQDRKWLDRLLGYFSFDLMDSYLKEYPTTIDSRVITSFDVWTSIFSQSTFRIYDSTLGELISDFYQLWKEIVEIGQKYYAPVGARNQFKFMGLQGDVFVSEEAEKDFGKIVDIQMKMQPLLKDIAAYIMDNFEIDVEATSNKFIESLNNE